MNDVAGKRVLICGDTEFLGRHIYRALRKYGPEAVWCTQPGEIGDDGRDALRELLRESRAEILIHLCERRPRAGHSPRVGGGTPEARAAFTVTAALGDSNLAKCVVVGNSLAYSPAAPLPWTEADFAGAASEPDGQSDPFRAERAFLLEALELRDQEGLPVSLILAGELYGPGEESRRQTGTLADALFRKVLEAREADREELRLPWSGTQSRDFLFVRDAAAGIALAASRCHDRGPLNLGTGVETTLGSLLQMMSAFLGYRGEIVWGQKTLSGPQRQCLDCRRAAVELGFSADTRLDAGIRETAEWLERQWSRRPAAFAG